MNCLSRLNVVRNEYVGDELHTISMNDIVLEAGGTINQQLISVDLQGLILNYGSHGRMSMSEQGKLSGSPNGSLRGPRRRGL